MAREIKVVHSLVDVVPVNEFTPAFSVASYQFSVQENTALGTVLGSVNASDGDAGSQRGLIIFLILGISLRSS